MESKDIKVHIDTINYILPNLPFLLKSKRSALLASALSTLLYGIKDSAERVENLLTEFSTEESQYNLTKRNVEEAKRMQHFLLPAYENRLAGYIPQATLGIWSILDAAHRFFLVYKEVSMEFTDPDYLDSIEKIKFIRNTFQHLDERLKEYYGLPDIGDSIFGDFSWRFRATLDSPEQIFLCKSGVTLGTSSLDGMDFTPSPESEYPTVGIYDVNINYVKQIPGSKKDGVYQYEKLTLSISKVISFINLATNAFDNMIRFKWGHDLGVAPLSPQEMLKRPMNGMPPFITKIN
jgi:hypothetical protein